MISWRSSSFPHTGETEETGKTGETGESETMDRKEWIPQVEVAEESDLVDMKFVLNVDGLEVRDEHGNPIPTGALIFICKRPRMEFLSVLEMTIRDSHELTYDEQTELIETIVNHLHIAQASRILHERLIG